MGTIFLALEGPIGVCPYVPPIAPARLALGGADGYRERLHGRCSELLL